MDNNTGNIRQYELSDNYNNNYNYLKDNINSSSDNIKQDKLNNNSNYKNLATEVKENRRKPNIGQGVKSVATGVAKRTIKGATSLTKSVLKKAPGAVAGATLGIAATIVSGGQNATSFIAGGTVAGAAISNNIAESVSDTVKSGTQQVKQNYNRGTQKLTKKEKDRVTELYVQLLPIMKQYQR